MTLLDSRSGVPTLPLSDIIELHINKNLLRKNKNRVIGGDQNTPSHLFG
jgi:hypothetical protein